MTLELTKRQTKHNLYVFLNNCKLLIKNFHNGKPEVDI